MKGLSAMKIRSFQSNDARACEQILQANDQLYNAEIEGREAMMRVGQCDAAVFLVAEINEQIVGLVRGVYDGSRALIHLLSVAPEFQRRGIASQLVCAIKNEFQQRGAPTVSVTVTDKSQAFWSCQGFEALPVTLMLSSTENIRK